MSADHHPARPARIGVIGAGRWAVAHHLPALVANERAIVTAVCDIDADRRRSVQERFAIEHGFADAASLCRSGTTDAVVVATTHVTHYDVAREALLQGLHVLVEKPMTLDPAEAWDLVATADARGVHLIVGYPLQFSAHLRRARESVQRIGDLHLVTAVYTSPRAHLYAGTGSPEERDPLARPRPSTYADPLVAGGGQGQTELTHLIAALTAVTGGRARSVTAAMRTLEYPVDVVDALLIEWEDGSIASVGSIGTVPAAHPLQREIRYYGSAGFVLQDLTSGVVVVHRHDGGVERLDPLPGEELVPTGAPSRCLVDLALGADENPSPGWLGAQTVECLSAAYCSAANDHRPTATYRPSPKAESS